MTSPMNADYALAQRVNTGNYLGIKFAAYEAQLYKMALSMPDRYFAMRQEVFEYLTETFAEEIYNRFFMLMTNGQKANGDQLIKINGSNPLYPNVEIKEINKFALSAAQTMKEISEKCMDKLLPIDFDTIMKRKITKDGLAAASPAT